MSVRIERVQIDDGFLTDLDVRFAAGLNVLIGARGTGKTSLIELVRFALGAQALTDDAARRGHQQALSVLQDGRVTVVLRDGEERFVITRSARDEAPRSDRPVPPLTVLAQSEIEAVGAQASGRLHLIDRFRVGRSETDQLASRLSTELRSVTAEISNIRHEVRTISEQTLEMATVRSERREAVAEQQELLKSIAATAKDRQELAALQAQLAELGVRGTVYERTEMALDAFRQEIIALTQAFPQVEEWPDGGGPADRLSEVRARRNEAIELLRAGSETIEHALADVRNLLQANTADRVTADEEARESRRALDALQAGAGALTRKVEDLTEREAQLGALEQLALERAARVQALQQTRCRLFDEMQGVREARFESRRTIADRLNTELLPEIRTDIVESGSTASYASAIVAALRGSGLHYNTLAPLLANRMSPLELVEAVESSDIDAITEATGVIPGRAESIISYLQPRNLSELIAAPVEDAVQLSLLDGSDYKSSDKLSIGQRCTAVLPVLLSGHSELLIVDQPEDHLDNAFITSTLVERLRDREPGDQFILASHNANIPVLGEADLVVRLDSDGRRGFIAHAGDLEDLETVRAITSVMEGGVEAFERRAAFYHKVLGESHG